MKKNIKMIIKKLKHNNADTLKDTITDIDKLSYFKEEKYEEIKNEFKYFNKKIIIKDLNYLYNKINNFVAKNKLLYIIFIIFIITLLYII